MSVSLVKGGNVSLSKEAGHTLTGVQIGLGWDGKSAEISGAEFDLDAAAFALDASGKVLNDSWFIFFGNLRSPGDAIVHTGDNLTGAGDGDDEVINIDFSKLPATVAKIVFSVTIYEGDKRKQNFGLVDNSYIRAVDPTTGIELAKYELDMEASLETVVVFGEVFKHGSDWKLLAKSAGFPAGLDGLCRQYGVNI